MNRQDAEEWTQALGQIVAGSWRMVALAKQLGVPKLLGLTTEEWVNKHLGGYVKLNVEDRREAVKELKADGYSTREIGEVLGVVSARFTATLFQMEHRKRQDGQGNGGRRCR